MSTRYQQVLCMSEHETYVMKMSRVCYPNIEITNTQAEDSNNHFSPSAKNTLIHSPCKKVKKDNEF